MPLTRVGRVDRWTEEEMNILKNLYGKISVSEIARKLGRTHKAVLSKIKKEKIRLPEKLERDLLPKYVDEDRFYKNWYTIWWWFHEKDRFKSYEEIT